MPHQMPLTHISFEEFVGGPKYALIHFWAAWNGYDVQMRNLIESHIPDEVSQPIAFGSLEIDPAEHHEICARHKLLNVPFLAFYRDGMLIRTTTGLLTAGVLTQYLRDLQISVPHRRSAQ